MRRSLLLVLLPILVSCAGDSAPAGPVDDTTPSADGVPIHY